MAHHREPGRVGNEGRFGVVIDAGNRNMALASAFVEELARCGVGRAVISPGSRSTPLAVALHRHPDLDTTVVVDERSAGFLALGAAQAARRPVVLLCTSGTAAANYHPAVAEADLSAVPLILLTADRPPELRDTGSGQTIDQLKLFGNAVRWFFEVGNHDADDTGLLHMRATACRAYAGAAGDPTPGPVHLNLPWREPLAPTKLPDQVGATLPLALKGREDRPLTRVAAVSDTPREDVVTETAELLADGARGLILAGRQTDPALRGPLTALAAECGYPILAEPTSQLRSGPHGLEDVIWAYDHILAEAGPELEPELILRFGEFPTSKRLRIWVAGLARTRQVSFPGHYAWNEPTRIAELLVRGAPAKVAEALGRALATRPPGQAAQRRSFREEWRRAQDKAANLVAGRLDRLAPRLSGPALQHALVELFQDGDIVYTNSSMAIRDQEAYLRPGRADVLFLANRGANGIDGLISSGIGAAITTGRPTTIITGDVALLHDLGALASWRLAPGPLRVIVVNDGGGRIFDRLPQNDAMPADEFAALMTTPPGIEPERVAALFGMPYIRLTEMPELTTAFAAGSALIEIPVDPSG